MEIGDQMGAEADGQVHPLQEHVPAVFDVHAARTHLRTMFARLDVVLGDDPVLTVHPADAVREDRDERDACGARDARRAEDCECSSPGNDTP